MITKTFYKDVQTNTFTDEAAARAEPDNHQRHTLTIETMNEVIAAEQVQVSGEEGEDAPSS